MATSWPDRLKEWVKERPVAVLRFADQEWTRLEESRHGTTEFTVARAHELLDNIRVPAPCLIQSKTAGAQKLFFGLIGSKSAVTTLESRIKVRRVGRIEPNTGPELLDLLTERVHSKNLTQRLSRDATVIALSPKLSRHLIERLASIDANHGAMRTVEASLAAPKYFRDVAAMQQDAVNMALRAFGLTKDEPARSLELVGGRETALARVGVLEDRVIEHDARLFPDYELVESYLTGRAVFERGYDRLEIFTANRGALEGVFGVDLIYLNVSRQNIVMLQYKMLEPLREEGVDTDWIYRPDEQLVEEIRRMKVFAADHAPGPHEYRLNPAVFYLKFVKRDGLLRNGSIITPIDHFEKLCVDPVCQGPKGGVRVSYNSLSGRYLRQGPFLDLVSAGYIGAHAEATNHLTVLVESVLKGGRSVVAAIQQKTVPVGDDDPESDLDGDFWI